MTRSGSPRYQQHVSVVFGLRVERFAGVLGQYRTLDHLNLRENGIQDVGAEGLTRVLTK